MIPAAIDPAGTNEPAIHVQLTDRPIDVQALHAALDDADCGARTVFLGCTRRTTGTRKTRCLVYEAYDAMALRQLTAIAEEAMRQFTLARVRIVHRLGEVVVGQASIAVGVASPHRQASFDAVAWIMNRIKADVAIWKQEHDEDGSHTWIHA